MYCVKNLQTLLFLVKKAFSLGGILDMDRREKPITVAKTAVGESIEHWSMKFTRKRSAELDITQTTKQDHKWKALKVKCFRSQSVTIWGTMTDRSVNVRELLTKNRLVFWGVVFLCMYYWFVASVECLDQRCYTRSTLNHNVK